MTLISAEGAALYMGVAWWQALVAAARAAHPSTPCTDVLDCADSPGRAMAALRMGQRALVLTSSVPGSAAVDRIASAAG